MLPSHWYTHINIRIICLRKCIRRVWRYQRVIRISKSKTNRQHNDQKKKVQNDKQRSIKHTHKTKDRVTRILQKKSGGELRCSGRVPNSCSISGTRRGNLVTNPIINYQYMWYLYWCILAVDAVCTIPSNDLSTCTYTQKIIIVFIFNSPRIIYSVQFICIW